MSEPSDQIVPKNNTEGNENEQLVEAEQEENETETDFNNQVDQQRQQYQPTKLESFFAITKSLILRAIVIYFISSFFRRPATNPVESNGVVVSRNPAINMFENGTSMDLYVFVNEAQKFKATNKSDSLVWTKKGLIYGEWTFGPSGDNALFHKTTIKTTQHLQNNGSLYMHVFVTRHGEDIDLSKNSKTIYISKQLNKYKKLRYVKTHNLLTGESTASEEEIKKAETLKEEVISHWHPNITINIVVDYTNWLEGSVPMPLDEYINFLPGGDKYKPVVYLNDYWNMLRDYQPINKTTNILDLNISFQPLSLFKWQLYCAQAMRNKFSFFGDAQEDDEHDSLKEALIETSPYLLALTVVVSLLHSVFELLAFKNDIQFWNNRKSLEGLSVRSVFFNVFQSTVVLLYVLDNDTNTVVRLSCFVGLGIEIWKIHKVMDIKIDRENKFLNIFPRVHFQDKGSYVESSTREYDMMAFKYLSWLLYPLLFGYIIYSLFYQEHRGWYSFVLNILYGFLLTFGFIMMTPQLFINYKLKSVAHLPWRMMSYKFLNTFIDDIFAFVIKMPTLYRLGCFRDDIVFFIFLYQRWIYKTDPSRLNEFGFSGEMEQAAANPNKEVPAIQDENVPPLAIQNDTPSGSNESREENKTKNVKSIKDQRQKRKVD